MLIAIVGIAHAYMFPQETRCIFIDFYDFEKEGNLYFREGLDSKQKLKLQNLILQAEQRVDDFWKGRITQPKYIYCAKDEDYLKFGLPFMTVAVAKMKIGSYVVISKDGIDMDILAHEISHTELYERIGFWNRFLKIPTWFDEGLAMQVDYRDYYSVDTLKRKTNNLQSLPNVKQLVSPMQFGNGTHEEVMLNYMTSKYVVEEWYSEEVLKKFIKEINEGTSFDKAFGK